MFKDTDLRLLRPKPIHQFGHWIILAHLAEIPTVESFNVLNSSYNILRLTRYTYFQ